MPAPGETHFLSTGQHPRDLAAELTPGGEVSPFVTRIQTLLTAPPVTCSTATSVTDAARLMKHRAATSVVVVGADGTPLGILTDRDFGTKVVAADLSLATPVGAIMSSPLICIESGELAFHALLEMTRRKIHHLGVVEDDRFLGVVSSDDLMQFHGAHPVALSREIELQESVDGLAAVAPRIQAVVRWFVGAGASPFDVGRIVAELNDHVVRRALMLVQASLEADGHGRAPVPYSWFAGGSAGRREQTLKTDQDNGLVYEEPPEDLRASTADYFERLSKTVASTLVRCGLPLCAGGYMASNPEWCQPQSRWRRHFASWMTNPHPGQVLSACIYFDIRPVGGEPRPGRALWDWVSDRVPSERLFLRWMARAALDRAPQLGLFGGFVVKSAGEHKDTLDIKAQGTLPMVQAMRVYALSLGLRETNTVDRLLHLGAQGVFTPTQVQELREAYEIVCRVRLVHQVGRLDAGLPPDNFVNPQALGKSDRLLLKEAFKTLRWLQRTLEDRFQAAAME
jgi:CBS domain-containing protein